MKPSATSMHVPALLALPATARAQAGPWVERIVSTSADGATSVRAADLDGNGDPDALSTSCGDDRIAWYDVVGARETVNLGIPPNPSAFLSGVTSGPVIGALWDPVLDHTAFQPGAVLDFVAISAAPLNVPTSLGTLLCAIPPALLLSIVLPVWVAGPVAAQRTSNNIQISNGGDVLVFYSNPSPGSTSAFCDTANDLYWKVYTGEHHLNHGEGIAGAAGTMEIDSFSETLFDTDWSTSPTFFNRSIGPALPDPVCGENLKPAFFQLGFTSEVCVSVGLTGFPNPCLVMPSLCSPSGGTCPPPGFMNGYFIELNFPSTPGSGVIVPADGTSASDLALTYFVTGGMTHTPGTGACGLGDYVIQDVHSIDESAADANTCAPGTSPWSGFQSAGSGPIPDLITSAMENYVGFREMTLELTADSGAATLGDGPFEGGSGNCSVGGATNALRLATVAGGGLARLSTNVFDNAGSPAGLYFLGATWLGTFPNPGVTVLGGQLLLQPHAFTHAMASLFSGLAPTSIFSCLASGEPNVVQYVVPRGGVETVWIPIPAVSVRVRLWFQAVVLDPGSLPPSARFSNVASIRLEPL